MDFVPGFLLSFDGCNLRNTAAEKFSFWASGSALAAHPHLKAVKGAKSTRLRFVSDDDV
jgi:hypothetical protein